MSLALKKGLPSNLDVERLVLGAVLLDDRVFVSVAAVLTPQDFSLEKHRRIFRRMLELHGSGERIDRVTVANELLRYRELESCDGLSYLVSLDDGLPHILNLDAYTRIVKDKAVLRQMAFASQYLMNRCLMGQEEPDEILARAEETLHRLGESRIQIGLTSARQIVDEYAGGINTFLDPSQRVQGLRTGFSGFDDKTSGLHAGDLMILAARQSMGKTALALNMAHYVATRVKLTVAIFSLEMSRESLLTRLLCATARVDSQKFRAGYLNAEERQRLQAAAASLVEAPLHIDDTAGLHLTEMHAKLRRLKSEQGLGLVIVDYLQLMAGQGRYENRNQEIGSLSRDLKLLANELHVPILVLSQLNRAPETRPGDHRPQLSDLRESGSIEQDADLVAFLFREEIYRPNDESLRGIAELILAKQRNGPVGKIKLVFLREFTKFEDRAQDSDGME
jgi:replicative DNA helicase